MTVVQGSAPDALTTEITNNVDVTTGISYGSGALDWTVSGAAASLDSLETLSPLVDILGGTWTPTYSGGTLSFEGANVLWNASGSASWLGQTCYFTQTYTCSRE
jgi:hypothetical protein